MKLNLYRDKNNTPPHVDIYYAEMQPVIQQIMEVVAEKPVELVSKYEDEIIYIPIKDVYYLDCVDKKVFAYTKDAVYPLKETLAYYEEHLVHCGYIRVSKSSILNIYRIKEIKSDMNMRICATFDNAEKMYINRSYKAAFMKYLSEKRGRAKHEGK